MAASAGRRAYQRRVESLLAEIERRRRDLHLRAAYGVRPAAMRDLKAELQGIRDELAAVIAAGSSPARAAVA